MQWPEVARLLIDEFYRADVQTYLASICVGLQSDGNWKIEIPVSNGMDQMAIMPGIVQIIDDLRKRRDVEKDTFAHWCNLPWEVWLRDKDFRYCLKYMEAFWLQSETGKGDQLGNTLDLAKLTTL